MRTDIKVAGTIGFAVIAFLVIVGGYKLYYWLGPRFEVRFGVPLEVVLRMLTAFLILCIMGFIIMTIIEEWQRRRNE